MVHCLLINFGVEVALFPILFFEMQRRIAEILMPMQCIRIRIGIIINLRSISLAKILLNAVKKGFLFKADDGENNILQQ